MTYQEFFARFGGSYRTIHLTTFPRRIIKRIKWILKFLRGRHDIFDIRRRFFTLPQESGAPEEFIRLDPWEGEYLFTMAARAKHCIVEIGRLHGGSTFLLASANADVPIYSIDLDPKNDERLSRLLQEHGLGKNVHLLTGDSQKGSFPDISDIDLLFIDGDHSYEGCSNDLVNWYPKVLARGHVLLHDSYFGCDVQSAVADFIQEKDPGVVVSPFISPYHWHSPLGSLAHLMKKD